VTIDEKIRLSPDCDHDFRNDICSNCGAGWNGPTDWCSVKAFHALIRAKVEVLEQCRLEHCSDCAKSKSFEVRGGVFYHQTRACKSQFEQHELGRLRAELK